MLTDYATSSAVPVWENYAHVVELSAGAATVQAEFFPKKFEPAGLALPLAGY